jgi:hypothetical protein
MPCIFCIAVLTMVAAAVTAAALDQMQGALQEKSGAPVRKTADTDSVAKLETTFQIGGKVAPIAVTIYKTTRTRTHTGAHSRGDRGRGPGIARQDSARHRWPDRGPNRPVGQQPSARGPSGPRHRRTAASALSSEVAGHSSSPRAIRRVPPPSPGAQEVLGGAGDDAGFVLLRPVGLDSDIVHDAGA